MQTSLTLSFLSFQNLEFHGVVRFYFQDEDHNVVTKCIRVASSATTQEVVDVLVEKFRPDMRMLTANRYNLFEVHVNGGKELIVRDWLYMFVAGASSRYQSSEKTLPNGFSICEKGKG